MPTITDVKRRIIELSPAEFQEFCDVFLSKKIHGKLHGYGMKAGTGKTTIGNPDSYFRKEDGKYIFVAYTMQETSIYSKLKEDIEKCLDQSETGIYVNDIDKIICCHTSSNLKPGDDKKLHDFCEANGVELIIYGVDEISNQVLSNYPSLAKDYLGLSINTNQILSMDDFILQCDANGLSAPLNTKFQFRNLEKDMIIQSLLEKNIVIVTGRAGVGKTRLVLESVKDFSLENEYKLLCVKNNNLRIYEDLVSATERRGKYIFFIDDANELADIKQILSYTNKQYMGYDVKVIATVRDYAKNAVINVVTEYCIPKIIQVNPFTDEEIKEFLDENLGIKNNRYINKIIEIAEGNPRIAYMAGKLAKEKESLSAINDISQLYEIYYKRHVDDTIGKDKDLCFTAGILSVVNAVMLNDLSALQQILDNYGITEEKFKNKIFELSQLEVVEIKMNRVATLSDQCLANYMLYYVFYQKKIITLGEVVEIGYKHFRNGVIKSINTIFNLFVNKETTEYCTQEILKVWGKFKEKNDENYYDFVNHFHLFRPEEGFLVAKNSIEKIEKEKIFVEKVDFNKNIFEHTKNILNLLSGYDRREHLEYIDNVIELLIEYCEKKESTLVTGCQWLKDNYGIKNDSIMCNFFTQKRIAELLFDYVKQGKPIASAIGLQWATYALGFKFRSSKMGRGKKFYLQNVRLSNTNGVNEYREVCWKILITLAQDCMWYEELIVFIKNYSNELNVVDDKEIIEKEKMYVEELLGLLDCDRFLFLSALEFLLRNVEKNGIHYNKFWKERLSGPLWDLYKILEDNLALSGLDYREYEVNRKAKLAEYGRNLPKEKIGDLIETTNLIVTDMRDGHDEFNINEGLELIIKGFDTKKTQVFVNEFIRRDTKISMYPENVFDLLNNQIESYDLLIKLKKATFVQKNTWLFAFFESLPCEKVNQIYLDEFLEFLKSDEDRSIEKSKDRNLRVLDKFINLKPDIYPLACEIIYKKREYSELIVRIYFELLFNERIYSPDELLELFKGSEELLQNIYFFALSIGRFEDYSGKFLKKFIELDESWLKKYGDYFWDTHRQYSQMRDIVLWKSDDFIKYFDYLFNSFPEDKMYRWEICNKFKEVLAHTSNNTMIKERQKEWLVHLIQEKSHTDKIEIIFNIICDLSNDLRRVGIETFLKANDDYNSFEKLTLLPNEWSGIDSFVSAYQEQIDFLKSLFPLVSGSKFLRHKIRIQKEIDYLKERIEEEEIKVIYQHLYM